MRNILTALIIAFALTACSHNLRDEFDTSLDKYNNMLGRNELGPASQFAADTVKEEFIATAAALKEVRIVDYKILKTKYAEEKHKASVEVEISYYNLYSNKVKSLRTVEEWTYSDERGVKGWRLMSVLPEFK
jgi:hypothetical protein